MELISMQGKTNFFERKVSEYQKAGVTNSTKEPAGAQFNFSTDMDF
jgi:ribonucleoside-diphosphate reductase beta chain